MKSLFVVICLVAAASLMGCSPISVKTDYDHEIDFVKYKTFKWMPHPEKGGRDMVRENSLLDKRIRRAVERELTAKGYELIESGRPDALLAYHVGVRERVDVSTVGYGYWRGRFRGRSAYVDRYKEGTLIIDFVDPELQQLVWRGAATGVIGSLEESEERINESVTKIFEKYPPK
ncbi:MAG TPA: DUF4136 domain-containing protein [bacterium]